MSKLPQKMQIDEIIGTPSHTDNTLLLLINQYNKLIDYLEQYERQKPCEHKNTKHFDGVGEYCTNCKKYL